MAGFYTDIPSQEQFFSDIQIEENMKTEVIKRALPGLCAAFSDERDEFRAAFMTGRYHKMSVSFDASHYQPLEQLILIEHLRSLGWRVEVQRDFHNNENFVLFIITTDQPYP